MSVIQVYAPTNEATDEDKDSLISMSNSKQL